MRLCRKEMGLCYMYSMEVGGKKSNLYSGKLTCRANLSQTVISVQEAAQIHMWGQHLY